MSINVSLNSGNIIEVYTSAPQTVELYSNPSKQIVASLNSGASISTSQSINKVIELSRDLSPTNHNDLLLIQGGLPDQYYHLNEEDYNNLLDLFSGGSTGYATISYVDSSDGILQLQITNLQENTGEYYLNSNPSGFITDADFSDYQTITGAQRSWISLVNSWTEEPSLNTLLASGEVYNYTYDTTTYYRFVPTNYVSSEDAFYSSFIGQDLSNLIVRRGMAI